MNELTNIDNLILLAILGGTIANLKNIASWVWHIFSSRLFSSIEVSNNTRTYTLLLKWMNDKYAHKVTNFAYATESNKGPSVPGEQSATEGGLYLGMGEFVFFYEGYPIWVSHDKKEITGTYELRTYQTIKIRSFRFAKKKLISILAQAESSYTEKGVRICTQGYDSWQYRGTRQPRDFTNVILPKEAEESIVSAVRHFADHRETYTSSPVYHIVCRYYFMGYREQASLLPL